MYETCEELLSAPLTNKEEILWRQTVTKEAIRYPDLFRSGYKLASELLKRMEAYREYTAPKYNKIINHSKKIITETEMLEMYIDQLVKLRELFQDGKFYFKEEPIIAFKEKLTKWLNDGFIEGTRAYIRELKSIKEGQSMTLTGHIFLGFKRTDYILNSLERVKHHEPSEGRATLWDRLFNEKDRDRLVINYIDMGIENNVSELIEANLGGIFKVLSQFNRKLDKFFKSIRYQFGFYYSCGKLYHKLEAIGVKCALPEFSQDESSFSIQNLMDIGIVIKEQKPAVGNTLSVRDKNLWLITGANQGGKTTFLRSIGLSILMVQSGLFVCGLSYKTKIFENVYTHFPSQEDEGVNKGLLEVELAQLDAIIQNIRPNSILLMNESFSTTTEKEGSQMAEEITRALREAGILTLFVTHLFSYADTLYQKKPKDVIFYCAGRQQNGERTYEIQEGKPAISGQALDLINERELKNLKSII